MFRASSSDSMRALTPVTSREALQRARGLHHRVERIDRRHHQQLHRLTLFLGDLHHVAEQFPLVVAEKLILGEVVFGRAGGNGPHGHHHDVVLAQVGFFQHALQVLHAAEIAHRHQHAARAGRAAWMPSMSA